MVLRIFFVEIKKKNIYFNEALMTKPASQTFVNVNIRKY